MSPMVGQFGFFLSIREIVPNPICHYKNQCNKKVTSLFCSFFGKLLSWNFPFCQPKKKAPPTPWWDLSRSHRTAWGVELSEHGDHFDLRNSFALLLCSRDCFCILWKHYEYHSRELSLGWFLRGIREEWFKVKWGDVTFLTIKPWNGVFFHGIYGNLRKWLDWCVLWNKKVLGAERKLFFLGSRDMFVKFCLFTWHGISNDETTVFMGARENLYVIHYLDVSENRGVPPNHPILIINHPFWGIPIFGNTQKNFGFEVASLWCRTRPSCFFGNART